MTLHTPMIITSRLLPGVKIADCTISLDRDGETQDGRDRFRYPFSDEDCNATLFPREIVEWG